jgi:putative inorganic carbon (hco3(-)) transporter
LELRLYLLFVFSWFTHLSARLPILGALRVDLLLVVLLAYLAFNQSKKAKQEPRTDTDRLLRTLIIYALITVPFVEWPGSVLKSGIPILIKAIVFYYFTVAFVKTEADLKKLIYVFIGCQAFRILEPVYLHVTSGYWGSHASMGNFEMLDRLSGAPSDVVNPNGLAFIICTALPFLWFLSGLSVKHRLASLVLMPACMYALSLTGSRSGILGMLIIYGGIILKSKKRAILITAGIIAVVVGFAALTPDMQDRYLSIFGKGEKNAGTASGRFTGVIGNFQTAMRRPLFGHGLSTSREVNANFEHWDQPAHNLYAETAQELGFIGLIILIRFIRSIFKGFSIAKAAFARHAMSPFLHNVADAMQVWLVMNFLFSFASFGLTSYEWYLFGGFSVVMQKMAMLTKSQSDSKDLVPAAATKTNKYRHYS